jgi:hypothetical protein
MLDTYPADLGRIDRAKLARCIEACFDCAQASTACADACLGERSVAELTTCVRANLDCADICGTTGRVLSRHTGFEIEVVRSQLQACVAACATCGDQCGTREGAGLAHSRICAQSCQRCGEACRDLLASLA